MPEFDFEPFQRSSVAPMARFMDPEAPQARSGDFFSLKDLALAPFRGVEGAFAGVYGLADSLLADSLPDWGGEDGRFLGRSETTLGGIAEGLTQFATGFFFAAPGRLLGGLSKAAGLGAKATGAGKAAQAAATLAARQITTDFIAFDGHDERLANLLQSVPALRNPVTEYLAAGADDGEIEGRIKNVLEGLALDPIIGTVVGGIKAIKRFHTAVAEAKGRGVRDAALLFEEGRKAGYSDPNLREVAMDAIVGKPDIEPPVAIPKRAPEEAVAYSDILGEGHTETRHEGRYEVSKATGLDGVVESVHKRIVERNLAEDAGLKPGEIDRDFPNISAEDVAPLAEFVKRVGPQLFDDVRMVVGNFREEGAYEFLKSVVRISNRAIRDGDFSRTALHEYWHSLERNLSPKEVALLRSQFERERFKFIQAGGPVAERVASGGRFTVSELEKAGLPREEAKRLARESYKYSSAQEWWAESLTEKTLSKFAKEAEIEGATGFKRLWLAGKAWVGEVFSSLGAKFGRNHAERAFRKFMEGKGSVTLSSARGLGTRNIALAEFTDPSGPERLKKIVENRKALNENARKIDSEQPIEAMAHPEDAETLLGSINSELANRPLNLRSTERAGGVIPVIRAMEATDGAVINAALEGATPASVRSYLDTVRDEYLEMAGSTNTSVWDAVSEYLSEAPAALKKWATRITLGRSLMHRAAKTFVGHLKTYEAGIKAGTIDDSTLAAVLYYMRATGKTVIDVHSAVREQSRALRHANVPVAALDDLDFGKGTRKAPEAPRPTTAAPAPPGTPPSELKAAPAPEAPQGAPVAPAAVDEALGAPGKPQDAPAGAEAPLFDGGFEGGGKAAGAASDPNALPFEGGFEGGGTAGKAAADPNALPFDGGFEGGGTAGKAAADPNALPFEGGFEGGGTAGKAAADPEALPFDGREDFTGGGSEADYQPHPVEIDAEAAREARNDSRAKRRTAQILEELGMSADDVTALISQFGGRREALKVLNRLLLLSHKEGKLLGVLTGQLNAAAKTAGDGANLNGLLKAVVKETDPRIGNAFTELYMNFILSGPKTIATNVLTGAIGAVWRPLELMLGGVPAAIRTQTLEPLLAPFDHLVGLASGVGDAWKFAYMTLKDENPRLSQFDKGAAIGSRERALTRRVLPDSLQQTPVGSAMDAFGAVVTSPSRVLQATDEFFSQLAYRADATVSLMREARQRGLTGDSITQYVAKNMETLARDGHALTFGRLLDEAEAKLRENPALQSADPRELTKLARLQAEKEWEAYGATPLRGHAERARAVAQEFNFTKPLDKNAGGFEGIAAGAQAVVAAHPYLRIFVPFIRTPTNILMFAGRRLLGLPQLMLESAGKRFGMTEATSILSRDLAEGGIKAQAATGRIMMGTGTMAALLAFADEGRITGFGPRDKDQRQALMASGWQPYSIRIGNQYVSFQRLDPLSTILGVAADTMDFSRRNPHADMNVLSSIVAATGIAMANNFTQKSYLMGFSSLIDALQDPEMNLARITQRLAAAATIPNFVTQIAGSQDPYLRQIRSYLDEVQNKTFASDSLEARRDIFGNPIARRKSVGHDEVSSWLTAVLPFDTTEISDEPVRVEMARLRRGFAVPKPEYGGIDLRNVKDNQGRSAYDRWMDNHQRVRLDGIGIEEAVGRLVRSSHYKQLPDYIAEGLDSPKAAAINGVLNKYRRAAYLKTMREVPALAVEDRRIRQARASLRS